MNTGIMMMFVQNFIFYCSKPDGKTSIASLQCDIVISCLICNWDLNPPKGIGIHFSLNGDNF